MAKQVVQGMQDQGVMACTKHFVNNNQGVILRLYVATRATFILTLHPPVFVAETNRMSVSANVDEVSSSMFIITAYVRDSYLTVCHAAHPL
jgi:beta-glucosidase-like glycosyl hydrolase